MGATPGKVYEPPEFTYEGTKPPSMDEIKSKNATPALLAEEVLLRRSPQRPGPWTVLRGHQVAPARR